MNIKYKIKDIKKFIESISVIGFDEYKKLFKLTEGDILDSNTWKERDVRKHRKYFALMICAFYHMPENTFIRSVDMLRKTVQISIGNCDIAFDMQGNKQLQANSISFKNMDQVVFDELYTKSLNCIVKVFLKEIDYESFTRDVLKFY